MLQPATWWTQDSCTVSVDNLDYRCKWNVIQHVSLINKPSDKRQCVGLTSWAATDSAMATSTSMAEFVTTKSSTKASAGAWRNQRGNVQHNVQHNKHKVWSQSINVWFGEKFCIRAEFFYLNDFSYESFFHQSLGHGGWNLERQQVRSGRQFE